MDQQEQMVYAFRIASRFLQLDADNQLRALQYVVRLLDEQARANG